jgi:hypothetical protein
MQLFHTDGACVPVWGTGTCLDRLNCAALLIEAQHLCTKRVLMRCDTPEQRSERATAEDCEWYSAEAQTRTEEEPRSIDIAFAMAPPSGE